ncbi:peptidoglycan-binding protein [Candidatus Peregrinibacteria bacterium]|nr:peptidoglycan-binding protein [Candidatus Peregrinibacteria bacterium]
MKTKKIPRHILAIIAFIAAAVPLEGRSTIPSEPFDQDFVITAYYSALPDQCCYVKGGVRRDRVLNGEGVRAADGTSVYAGMAAAPSSYPFGTVIHLPGIGTVKVHDRGGAINEQKDGTHRLDIWVGHGEEGLARALALGEVRMRGRVFPIGSSQPNVSVVLENLPLDIEKLKIYSTLDFDLLGMNPKVGDRGYTVMLLQEFLRKAGYFSHPVTGYFSTVTRSALAGFVRDFHIKEPLDHLTERTAAYLLARRINDGPIPFVSAESAPSKIQLAQRTLRFLGYYKGRTDGLYSDMLGTAILNAQQKYRLAGGPDSPGAGQIGPLTRKELLAEWDRVKTRERAEKFLLVNDVRKYLTKKGERLESFLGMGDTGDHVRLLQMILARQGYFPEKEINSVFGPLTNTSVLQYQMDKKLVKDASDPAAGYVGPATLRSLQRDYTLAVYRRVRGEGWQAL